RGRTRVGDAAERNTRGRVHARPRWCWPGGNGIRSRRRGGGSSMTASLKRTGLLAIQVFREAMRDRVWYATGAFAVVMAVAVVLIADITAGQEVKIVKDAGLALIELTAVGTAALLGVGLISRDVERRSIFLLLSKPVA